MGMGFSPTDGAYDRLRPHEQTFVADITAIADNGKGNGFRGGVAHIFYSPSMVASHHACPSFAKSPKASNRRNVRALPEIIVMM